MVLGATMALEILAPLLITEPSITTQRSTIASSSIKTSLEITEELTLPKIIAPWLAMDDLIEACLPK